MDYPVILYQNSESSSTHIEGNENSNSVNNAIGQVMLTPVSPVQNSINVQNRSPTVQTVNIQGENNTVSRPLNEIFNMQTTGSIQNTGAMFPVNQSAQQHNNQVNPDLASLISSLQAGGVQIVDLHCIEGGISSLTVPVISSQVSASDINSDKTSMAKFISSLQASDMQVVENYCDNTLTISLPSGNRSDEKQYNRDSSTVGIATANEINLKIVDGDRQLRVITGIQDVGDLVTRNIQNTAIQSVR